jgi:hypothetical protein
MLNGGKADALIKLQKEGLNTPKFFICAASDTEKDVLEKINKFLSKFIIKYNFKKRYNLINFLFNINVLIIKFDKN